MSETQRTESAGLVIPTPTGIATLPSSADDGRSPAPRRRRPKAAAAKPQPHHLRQERHDLVLQRRARGGPEHPEGAGDAVLHEPHVSRLALLVRLAAADG